MEVSNHEFARNALRIYNHYTNRRRVGTFEGTFMSYKHKFGVKVLFLFKVLLYFIEKKTDRASFTCAHMSLRNRGGLTLDASPK